MDKSRYDGLIVLGGGRFNDGSLTPLSITRLDKGIELYHEGAARFLFALGGNKSTYLPTALEFPQTGAYLRRNYFISNGDVPDEAVVVVEDGIDTIGEAFAARRKARELGLRNFLLVTSEKHMERAIFVFKRIFGKDFEITGNESTYVITGDLLNSEEEAEYLALWQEAFAQLPDDIPDPESWEKWHDNNREYYDRQIKIHDRFHPPGHESQAYAGVREK